MLTLISGAMHSGKTERLIKVYCGYGGEEECVFALPSEWIAKCGDEISAFGDGYVYSGLPLSEAIAEAKRLDKVVLIDEGEFLTQAELDEIFEAKGKIDFIVVSLVRNFYGQKFAAYNALSEKADEIATLRKPCEVCGGDFAKYNGRYRGGKLDTAFCKDLLVEEIDGEDAVKYVCACEKCWQKIYK